MKKVCTLLMFNGSDEKVIEYTERDRRNEKDDLVGRVHTYAKAMVHLGWSYLIEWHNL